MPNSRARAGQHLLERFIRRTIRPDDSVMTYIPGTQSALRLLDQGLWFETVAQRLVQELQISTDQAQRATLAALDERADRQRARV